MKTLLLIHSSPRLTTSISRRLADDFVFHWKENNPSAMVLERDLITSPVPWVDEEWIEASRTPEGRRTPEMQRALAVSDSLIHELLSCEQWVFSIPMHNLHVPTSFKAYLDQIIRVGKTYSEDLKGLVNGKKLLIITARGANYQPGSPWEKLDFQEPYLKAILGFIGVQEIHFVHAQGMQKAGSQAEESLAVARRKLMSLAAIW